MPTPLNITTFETGAFPEGRTPGSFQESIDHDRGPVPINQWTLGVQAVAPFATGLDQANFVQVSAWAHMFSKAAVSSFITGTPQPGLIFQDPGSPNPDPINDPLAHAWDASEIDGSYTYNGGGKTEVTSPLSDSPGPVNDQWLIANQWELDNITASPQMPFTYTLPNSVPPFPPGIWDFAIHISQNYLAVNSGNGNPVTGPFPAPTFKIFSASTNQVRTILSAGPWSPIFAPGVPPNGIPGSSVFTGGITPGYSSVWEYLIRINTAGALAAGLSWRPQIVLYYNSNPNFGDPVVVNWQANRVL